MSIIEQFAKELAAIDDPAQRQAMLARANVLAMQETLDEAFEPPIENLGAYMARELPVPPILVEPALVVRGGITCTIGRAGKGKTQMNLNRCLKWSAGKPMFEDLQTKDGTKILAPSEPLKILVIENEGAAGMFHRQMGIMLNAEGYLSEEDRALAKENILIWGDGGYSGLKLDDPADLSQVRAGCEKWNPDIVFIEPFRGLWKGEENSSTDMANVADSLSGIATDFDCGVILTHHEKKSGRGDNDEGMNAARGSTVLEGVVATMENFEIAKGGDFREVSWSKVRYGGGHKLLPVRMEWQHGAWWYKHVALDAIEQAVLDVLASDDEPQSVGDLVLATGEKEHGIRKMLKDMVETNKIRKLPSVHDGNGSTGNRYRINTGSSNTDPENEPLEF